MWPDRTSDMLPLACVMFYFIHWIKIQYQCPKVGIEKLTWYITLERGFVFSSSVVSGLNSVIGIEQFVPKIWHQAKVVSGALVMCFLDNLRRCVHCREYQGDALVLLPALWRDRILKWIGSYLSSLSIQPGKNNKNNIGKIFCSVFCSEHGLSFQVSFGDKCLISFWKAFTHVNRSYSEWCREA